MKPIRDSIDGILDEFDFEKVHRVMEFMNWKWAICDERIYDIPSISDLRKRARESLISVTEGGNKWCSCGGFYASNINGYIDLRFVIEEKGIEPDDEN